MVATTEELEGLFRPNDSLNATLRRAAHADGHGVLGTMVLMSKVRRLSSEGRQELEKELAKKVQEDVAAGTLTLPVSATIAGGVLVSGWQDLFQWFMDNLPAILEMIMMIIALFG